MSLATRCPACGTIFRVVQDQLKVSEGWVRCGQCHEVFHGIEALFDLDGDPAITGRPVAPPPASQPAPAASQPARAAPRASPSVAATTPPRPAPSGRPGNTPSGFAPSSFAPSSADATPPARPGFTPAHSHAPASSAAHPVAPPLAARGPLAPRVATRQADAAPASPHPPAAAPVAAADRPSRFMEQREAPASSPAAPAGARAPAHARAPEPAPMVPRPAPAIPRPAPPPSASELAAAFSAPAQDDAGGGSTLPSRLAEDSVEDKRAGPPTLASLLPEDVGEWPPRKQRRKRDQPASELALVDTSKDPRFLREARSGARWRKPWVRAVLSVALLALVAGAGAQLAWPQRDMLAARWPVARPAWDWLCEQAGCRIEAPRALASLALDGSSLTRTDTDHVLLFAADLHNRSDHEVRMPSFDLSFLDLNGEIVARKVLSPEQIGIAQASLPPDGELHVHARLQVGGLGASGFQADLFYP